MAQLWEWALAPLVFFCGGGGRERENNYFTLPIVNNFNLPKYSENATNMRIHQIKII